MKNGNAVLEQPQEGQHPLLTVSEVARKLRLDDTTIRRNIKQGAIPAWAVVTLPHVNERQAYRLKKTWLDLLLAGEDASQEPSNN